MSSGQLQRFQNEVLEAIACGAALSAVADLVCRWAERLAPDVVCSILAVDAQHRLQPLAAPSLPAHYSRALRGMAIGPRAGSCGTAAWRGEPVEVHDIAHDPLWADYRSIGLPPELLACWSSPIKAGSGQVVGTFAFYYRDRRGPDELERRIVDACVHLCTIAIEHDKVQSRIHHLAYHDPLTGLPNRVRFHEETAQRLAALRAGQVLNVLHVDLDDFKGANDTLGQRVGDLLLQGVARRLVACAGAETFVARRSGDEFALLQHALDGQAAAGPLAEAIIAALDEPFELEGHQIAVGASVGIAQATSAGADRAELSRRADMALYAAKCEGRGTYCFFAPEMDAATQSRRRLEQDLRHALDGGEFTLAYQPIIALATRELVAVEALLRWRHRERGPVPPAVFIPVVEEMGLIGSLGQWVLREACSAATGWPRAIKVGVNLSSLQFRRPGLVAHVLDVLDQTGLEPARLDLEITESMLLARDVATRLALHELHDLGVSLSLDDFGTGFASLQSLRTFPFDKLKIDMSFVRGLGEDADATAIVRAVIGLARDLYISTVAEGVERDSQVEWLVRHGCNEGQGYYFAEPMNGDALVRLLARGGGALPLRSAPALPTPG